MAAMQEPSTISEIMYQAIADRVFPGGAVAFGSCTLPCYYRAYGTYTFESSKPVTPESLWDMASLTKIMVTTPSIMILFDQGEIELEEYACKYLPEFGNNGKEQVTIYQLLTHTAGLREFYPFFDMGLGDKTEVLDYILNDKLWYPAGEIARYSDLSMIVLGLIVERISGVSLDVFVEGELFKPWTYIQKNSSKEVLKAFTAESIANFANTYIQLGLRDTKFLPTESSDFDLMIVPTEVDCLHRKRLLWGEVHDPTAFLLGGVAGHAGLFSTIIDVCRFAQMILAGGIDILTNRRFFKETTLQLFMTPGLPSVTNTHPFALGWDVALRRSVEGYTSAGKYLGPKTFGHTGLTGTSLWIDPERDLFVALLTNAVHPTAVGGFGSKVREVRPLIADAAVHTMEQQYIPQRSLRWQSGADDGGSRYQSLVHSGTGNHSTDNQDIRKNIPKTLISPLEERAAQKQTVGTDLNGQNLGPENFEESWQDWDPNNFALESTASFESNLKSCEEQRQSSRSRILMPVLLIALFVSIIS